MIWSSGFTWTTLAALLFSLVKKGNSLACFRCYSVDGSVPDCEDDFGTYNLKSHLLDRECKVGVLDFQGFYCVKIKGTKKNTGEQVVIRTCSVENWGTQCGDLTLEQGTGEEPPQEPIYGCLASCHFDGCNDSKTVSPSMFCVILLTLIGLFLRPQS